MGLLRPFAGIAPTPEEIAREFPGDDLVPDGALVMDRAFTLPEARRTCGRGSCSSASGAPGGI